MSARKVKSLPDGTGLFRIGNFLFIRNLLFAGFAVLFFLHSHFLCARESSDGKRILRVGYFPFDGFLMRNKDGRRSGYGYDYLQELRNYTNWTYEYTQDCQWKDMLSMLREGKIDLLPGVSKTADREKDFAFSKYPIAKVFTLMTVRAGNTRYHSGDYKNWTGIRVGLLKNSTQNERFMDFAKEKGFQIEPVWFDAEAEMIDALLAGREIDAAVTSALRKIRSGEWVFEQFGVSYMFIAVRKDDTVLLEELNRTMERVESQLPDLQEQLRRTYYTHKESGILSFNEQERKILAVDRVYTCLMNPDRKPLSWWENGEFHGIFKEYADEISKRTGLKFRFLPVATREEYHAKRVSPEVDIIFDLHHDRQEAEDLKCLLSQPFFFASVSVLRDKNAGNLTQTITILEPGDLSRSVRAALPRDVRVRTVKSLSELTEDVKSPNSDAGYMYTRSAEYAVYEDSSNQLVSQYIPSLENAFAIGVKDSMDSSLLAAMNKAVLSLDNSYADMLRKKYAPKFQDAFSFSRFLHNHPLTAVGIPFSILVLLCAFLAYVLSRRRKLYQAGVLFSQLPLRCFVLNAQGKILYCTLGQRSSLLKAPKLGSLDDIPDVAARSVMREKLADALKTSKQESVELQFEGQYRSAIVSKLPDSAFGPDTVIWISQDITELHASRAEIRRHEEFFRLTLQSIGDGAITTDADGNVTLLNPVAERMTGMTNAAAAGKPHEEVFRIVSEKNGSVAMSPLRKALDHGMIVEPGNHTELLSADGRQFRISACAGPIRNDAGNIIGAVLVFRDVTLEYSRREALRESVSNWEVASDLAKLYPYKVNIRTCEVTGDWARVNQFWPIHDGIATKMSDWIMPEDLENVRKEYESVKAGRQEKFMVTYRAELDGKTRYYRWFGRMDKSDPETMTGLIQDITEVKEAELERESAISLWEQALDAAPLLMFIKSEADDFRYEQCNKHFAEFAGLAPELIKGRTDAELFTRYQNANAFREKDRKIIESGKPLEFMESAIGANGKMYYFQTVKMPFREASGKMRLIGMSADITEVMEQKERLRSSNAQLEIGSRLNRSVMFHLNARTLEISATDMLAELWPMRSGKILSQEQWVLPEDLPVVEWWLNALRNETSETRHQVEFRTDYFGARRYYRTSVQPSIDASGDLWLTGATQDVTELMEAAAKLRDSSLMWKNVMDELPVLFFVKDAGNECRYVMCNKANAEFLGFPAEEVLGKTTRELGKKGALIDSYLLEEERILDTDEINRTRLNIPDSRGVLREIEKIEMSVTPQNGGKLLVGIAFDITEREQNYRLATISMRILAGIAGEPDFRKVLDIVGWTVIDICRCRRVLFASVGKDGLLHYQCECDSKKGDRFADGPVALHEKLWNSYLDRMRENEILCFDRLGMEVGLHTLCKDYPEYRDSALAAIPVVAGGRLCGIMIVTYPESHSFTKIERKMLRTIGDCLVIAVSRAEQDNMLLQTRQERARQEADRNAINDCLNVFITSDYMNVPFEQILEIIRKHLGASHCIALRIDRETCLETCLAEATESGRKKFLEDIPPIPFDPNSFWYTELEERKVFPWKDLRAEGSRALLSTPWRTVTDAHGIRSVWNAALNPGGVLWGSLEIVYDERAKEAFSEQDESFVRSAAHLVSMILMRALGRDNLIETRDRLTVALQQAQSAEKAKSYFLASMSHEIRTPLNAVIGFTEMMREDTMTEEARRDCLDSIYSSGNALLQLINDILDLSKLEADQMPILPERTDFPTFCNEVCRTFQYAADQKNLKLIINPLENMPLVMLDKLRMRQILFNLVGNAIKFTREGSVTVSCVFSVSSDSEGTLLLQIADTGTGIPEADRKKLFEPFVQLSKMRGTNSSNNGTGLGLVIVRKLADRMDGVLSVESEEGKGSTFSLLLSKVAIVDETQNAETVSAPVPHEPDRTVVPVTPEIVQKTEKLRVLVADGSAMNVKIMKNMLNRLDVDTDSARSGTEALEKLTNSKFDLVFTAWALPDMNGAELLNSARANPLCREVRLVVIRTEHETVPDSSLYSAVLIRPVSPRQLRECIFRRNDIE